MGGDFPIGDAYKLYWHFDRYEKNGIIGIFITVFLYIVTMFSAATILYMYFLRVHNSGRLLDVYHRLNGKEDQFFVPYDLEISLEELTYICRKAEQWRGEEGERRKVAVYDYVWEEEEVRNAPDVRMCRGAFANGEQGWAYAASRYLSPLITEVKPAVGRAYGWVGDHLGMGYFSNLGLVWVELL